MPSRGTHAALGAAAGAGYAFARADKGCLAHIIAETIGGAFVGRASGVLPDVLEPATSPRHRSTAHSLLALIGAVVGDRRLRRLSNDLGRSASLARDPWEALLLRFLRGGLHGATPGYMSHLLADATTPAGLPVFRG